jgi:D-alanyl-D-alanine carboxypeptidase/D-alanyl-D-alanine-endopeptidase (penicillin-binding protein 4)
MSRFRLLPLLVLVALPALAQDPSDEPAASTTPEPATTTPAPEVPSGSSLKDELSALSTDPIFTSSVAGVYVVDADSGETLFSAGEEKGMMPASVMKTLTAATALRTLGPTYRFPTWVMTDGEVGDDGVLKGNLYIKGQGDPTMVVERMWKMVHDIQLSGIREIKGDVVFDDGYFADSTLIPGWEKEDDLKDGPTYFAPLGALSLNYNIATLLVRPGSSVGSDAAAFFETPTPAVVMDAHVTTGRAGSRVKLEIERKVDEETGKVVTFTVNGSVPMGGDTEHIYKTLSDPLGNYIGGFQSLTREVGIKVRGSYRAGTTPKAATLVTKEESETLANILEEMNKHSNNFMAEQILRSIGAETYGLPGTTEKGLRSVNEYLLSLGIPAEDFHLVNGSGLSRDVRVRPSTITKVLASMWQDVKVGPEFLATLSVGGRDGTLWARFRDEGMAGRVRGKTGTLSGVTCLAGYVNSADGHTYAFSFLVNDLDGALSRARGAHDRLVKTLAGIHDNIADGGEPNNGEPR